MIVLYDRPTEGYTTRIPAGTAALRQALGEVWGVARTEVVRDRARCVDTPSEHCVCRAVDVFASLYGARRGLFEVLVSHAAQLGVQSVIADGRVWGFGEAREREYTGPDPHTSHVHVGITRKAAATLSLDLCRSVLGAPKGQRTPAADRKGTAVDPKDIAAIASAVWELAVANAVDSEQAPAHALLTWAHLDANTALREVRALRGEVAALRAKLGG